MIDFAPNPSVGPPVPVNGERGPGEVDPVHINFLDVLGQCGGGDNGHGETHVSHKPIAGRRGSCTVAIGTR